MSRETQGKGFRAGIKIDKARENSEVEIRKQKTESKKRPTLHAEHRTLNSDMRAAVSWTNCGPNGC